MKQITRLSSLFVLAIILSACNTKKESDTPYISVTHTPQKYFVESIVGNKFEVNTVVPPGSNPENMDFTPSQLISLTKSIAYFKIGYLEIENQIISKTIDTNKNLKIFDTSENIEIIKDEYHEDSHTGKNHEHHSHADGDPHTWSSTQNALIMAANILDAMLKLDSENAEYYKSNYATLVLEINKTDSIIKDILRDTETKSFVIYHPALSYFARDNNLNQLTIEYMGKQPSPNRIKELVNQAKKEKVKVVFIQEEFDVKNAETIAKSINSKTVTLDLLSYDWHNEMIKIAKAIAE